MPCSMPRRHEGCFVRLGTGLFVDGIEVNVLPLEIATSPGVPVTSVL